MLFSLSVELVVWRVLAQPLRIRLAAESGRKNLWRMVFIKTRNDVSGDAEFGAKNEFMRGDYGKKTSLHECLCECRDFFGAPPVDGIARTAMPVIMDDSASSA